MVKQKRKDGARASKTETRKSKLENREEKSPPLRETEAQGWGTRQKRRVGARPRRESESDTCFFGPGPYRSSNSEHLRREPQQGGNMEYRKLGKNGPRVSALGLGCMGMSFAYGPADEEESLRVLRRYLELGGNFLDTAEIYGPYKNEELLGRFLREVPRDSVIVATKFGFRIGAD